MRRAGGVTATVLLRESSVRFNAEHSHVGSPGTSRPQPRLSLSAASPSASPRPSGASLLNQLFGKSKEPFWQQAYINLIRWLIELHRALPEQWVTFRDLYHCPIDPDRIGQKIEQARALSGPPPTFTIVASRLDVHRHRGGGLLGYQWQPASGERVRTTHDQDLLDTLTALGIQATVECPTFSG